MGAKTQKLLAPTESGLWQMIRFGMVGAVSFVADTGTLWVLAKKAHMWYIYGGAISYLIGIAVSYTLSVVWVFSHRNIKDKRLEFLVFAAIGVVAMLLTEGILFAGVEWFHLDLMIAKYISVFLVFFFNYGARKVTMFKAPQKTGEADLSAAE